MMYSDGIHLISDVDLADLHRYARSIGIKRCWFHNGGGGRFPHYDIPKLKRKAFFVEHPDVQEVSARDIVKIFKGEYNA